MTIEKLNAEHKAAIARLNELEADATTPAPELAAMTGEARDLVSITHRRLVSAIAADLKERNAARGQRIKDLKDEQARLDQKAEEANRRAWNQIAEIFGKDGMSLIVNRCPHLTSLEGKRLTLQAVRKSEEAELLPEVSPIIHVD